eukprot:COSAG01_NODE_20918_length_928_cov_0.697226_1_plen_282_part_01
MKFTATFGTEEDRKELFQSWARGGWEKGDGTMSKEHERGDRPNWWEDETNDLGLDINYLVHLAKKTAWGRRRIAEYKNKSLIKSVLGIDTYKYDPQFGQVDVAYLVAAMLPPLKYDSKNKTANEGLFRLEEHSGIWISCEKDWIKRFCTTDIVPFIERQLIPSVVKRGKEIKDMVDESSEIKKEYEYLLGVYKPTKQGVKLVEKGLFHKLQDQLQSMHNEAPRTNIASAVQTNAGFSGPPYLPQMWNNVHELPELEYVFPCKNGVIDLKTMSFRPAKASEMI